MQKDRKAALPFVVRPSMPEREREREGGKCTKPGEELLLAAEMQFQREKNIELDVCYV